MNLSRWLGLVSRVLACVGLFASLLTAADQNWPVYLGDKAASH